LKEIGVGWTIRMAAKTLKPRIIICENNGKWTVRSESTLKIVTLDFTPGVEFNETTPDGREVTVCLVMFRFLILFLL
jgi:fatty acid-binding protein 3